MDSLSHPCITATHLSYRVLSLKLPPPPCAVVLVMSSLRTLPERQVQLCRKVLSNIFKLQFEQLSQAIAAGWPRFALLCKAGLLEHMWPFWAFPFDAVNESRSYRPRWLACGDTGAIRSFVLGSAKHHSSGASHPWAFRFQPASDVDGRSLWLGGKKCEMYNSCVDIFPTYPCCCSICFLVEIAKIDRNTGWSAV